MLRELYRDYLQAGAEPLAAAPLARGLATTPLAEIAQLLHDYARGGTGSYPIAAGDRTGQHAFVGAHPPSAGPGALWLDVVDLSLSVLVPTYVDPDDRDALAPEAVARVARD